MAHAVHVRSLHMGASICVLFRDGGLRRSVVQEHFVAFVDA